MAQRDEKFQAVLNNIGQNIRAFRKAIGLTQQDLGDRSDLARNSISRIEQGAMKPDLHSLSMIAFALEKPLADFFQPAVQAHVASHNGQGTKPVPDEKAVAVQSPKPP